MFCGVRWLHSIVRYRINPIRNTTLGNLFVNHFKIFAVMSEPIKIGIIGGTGLDDPTLFKNREEKKVTTPYGDPSDSLILGEIDGTPVVMVARHGRAHSISPGKINYRANVYALSKEGCTHILATTATGSLREHIDKGDLVVLDSFIDRTQGREQSFADGIIHLPMEPAFCERTRQIIIKTANQLQTHVHKVGTVVAIEGPRFSSKAESKMFRLWGGDVINMTTVPEVVLAKEAGILYAQVALVTDYDCWKPSTEIVSHKVVLNAFKENVTKLTNLLIATIPNIAKENWDETIKQAKKTVQDSLQC